MPKRRKSARIQGEPKSDHPKSKVFATNPKDVSPFAQLPYEVIEHILTFLDYESLVQCSLVNKQFSEVIDTSLKLMKHFTLFVDNSYFKEAKDIGKLRRRHGKIVIETLDFDDEDFVKKALPEIGQNARELNIRCYVLPEYSRILEYFPVVQKLIVDSFMDIDASERSMLTDLKELRFQRCKNIQYFENIRTLQKLHFTIDIETFDSVKQLLSNQQTMELLILDIVRLPKEKDMQMSLRKDFKVRRLFIKFTGLQETTPHAMKLALNFKERVECLSFDLDVQRLDRVPVLEEIMDNFKSITALRLDIDELPRNQDFYTEEKVHEKLTDLVLFTSKASLDEALGLINLFKIFPNLQNLTIPYARDYHKLTEEDSLELNSKLRQLKTLTLGLNQAPDIFHPLPQLSLTTSLLINGTDWMDPVPWNVYSKSFPNLRGISFGSVGSKDGLNFWLKPHPKLEVLRLGLFWLTYEKLHFIRRFAPNLKTLIVRGWDEETSLEDALTAMNIKELDVKVIKGKGTLDAIFPPESVFNID